MAIDMVDYEYRSDFFLRFQAQGKAKSILKVIDVRGLVLADDTRMGILTCTDQEQLDQWLVTAITIEKDDYLPPTDMYLGFQARGQARGAGKAILKILEVRGLPVPEEVRRTVLSCKEEVQLDHWLVRAITVECTDELFDSAVPSAS